jgi:succinate dehydrogenase / fumarate reductase membrane anchor subunit
MAIPVQERQAGIRSGRRPRQNFETWSWFFMRVSGLALLFLALAHFSITHLANDVTSTNAHFVSHRWNNPLWRIFDWLLLALGLFHGVNGVRLITDDYVRSPGWRVVTKAAVYTLTFTMIAYGTFAIVSFTPFHGSP